MGRASTSASTTSSSIGITCRRSVTKCVTLGQPDKNGADDLQHKPEFWTCGRQYGTFAHECLRARRGWLWSNPSVENDVQRVPAPGARPPPLTHTHGFPE